MVDLIIFASLAIFVVIKLRKMLGDEYEGSTESKGKQKVAIKDIMGSAVTKKEKNIIKVLTQGKQQSAKQIIDRESVTKEILGYDGGSIDQSLIPSIINLYESVLGFTYPTFMQGVRYVFESVVDAYSRGDLAEVSANTRGKVSVEFISMMNQRKASGTKENIIIARVESVKIESINTSSNKSDIAVNFVSTQIAFVEDAEGNVIEGSKSAKYTVSETWQFTRETSSQSPDWFVTNIIVH